jgi:protein disulfide isomerase family A protein 3
MIKLYCFLAFVGLAIASDVLELSSLDSLVDHDLALVKFYAPWCGHCKRMAPEFDAASTILKNDDSPVALVKVDCTADGKDACSKHGVSGYPTLKVFKNGEFAFDYNGPREKDGIVKYMRGKAGPSSRPLDSVAAATKFTTSLDAGIVGFFPEADTDLHKDFMKAAGAMSDDHRFAHTTDEAVLKEFGIEAESVVLFRPKAMANKFEDSKVTLTEGKLSDIKTFIKDNVHGLAGLRTSNNQDKFEKPLVVVFYNVDYVKDPKGTNYWRNRVMKVGKKLLEAGKSVHFAVANADDAAGELSEMNLNFEDKPVVAARDKKDMKYVMTETFSMDTFEKFVTDFLDGKLKPYLKSEPVPEDNTGGVKTVVAENFDEIVNDPSRDVLIEFYAPWCGHCKSLAPKYDELGEKLINDETVTIAKMDATANDVPKQYTVKGFPTIYYAPKNSKDNPKKYEGAREVNDFLKWLAKESTDGLQKYDRKGKAKKEKKEKKEEL